VGLWGWEALDLHIEVRRSGEEARDLNQASSTAHHATDISRIQVAIHRSSQMQKATTKELHPEHQHKTLKATQQDHQPHHLQPHQPPWISAL
jgi:hypothetical protein